MANWVIFAVTKGNLNCSKTEKYYFTVGKAMAVHFTRDCSYIVIRAGIFKQSLGARNRKGIGLSYRPARLRRLMAEFIP